MKIIIIGLGLIGGSIAKQLSEKNEFEILAYDLNQESINNALAPAMPKAAIKSAAPKKKSKSGNPAKRALEEGQ